jgi:hypothetical protein
MADPLSIASSVVSLIAVAGRIVDIYVGTFRKLDAAKTSIRKENQHLGLSSTIQYLIPPLYTRIKTLEEDVLSGSDEVLQSFRESHSSYCNMVAIAVSIDRASPVSDQCHINGSMVGSYRRADCDDLIGPAAAQPHPLDHDRFIRH